MAFAPKPVINIAPPRLKRQYIAEWMRAHAPEGEEMVPAAEIVRATGIDKSTISRWVNNPNQIPQDAQLEKLAGFFNLDDPESLLRHPDDDWLTRVLRGANAEEKRRMRQLIEAAFPAKRRA